MRSQFISKTKLRNGFQDVIKAHRTVLRCFPARDFLFFATSSGVPTATIFPPSSPPRAADIDDVLGLLQYLRRVLFGDVGGAKPRRLRRMSSPRRKGDSASGKRTISARLCGDWDWGDENTAENMLTIPPVFVPPQAIRRRVGSGS